MKRPIIMALAAVLVIAAAVLIYMNVGKGKVDAKAAAAAFPRKKWFYSTDGGKSWTDRAEMGLKGFKESGEPIHIYPEWIKAEWKDENTIYWTAVDNSTSIWKSFDIILTDEEIAKNKAWAAAFASKTWYYSLDDGGNWAGGAAEGLKGFDDNGQPIHVSNAWISGRWKDENTIHWVAVNGNESTWKAFESPPY